MKGLSDLTSMVAGLAFIAAIATCIGMVAYVVIHPEPRQGVGSFLKLMLTCIYISVVCGGPHVLIALDKDFP